MLIKVTVGQVVARAHTIGPIQVAKRVEAERLESNHTVDTKRTTNTHLCILKAIHNHFQEFCENLRPFVLKKCRHDFTKL